METYEETSSRLLGLVEPENYVLTGDFEITNVANFTRYYKSNTGQDCDLEELSRKISDKQYKIFYFDEEFKQVPSRVAKYAWIQTEFIDDQGYPIVISLRKYLGMFSGYVIASANRLKTSYKYPSHVNSRRCFENMTRFINKISLKDENQGIEVAEEEEEDSIDDSQEVCGSQGFDVAIFENMRNILLVDNWETSEGFRRFIFFVAKRAAKCVAEGRTEYYVKNKVASIVVNTGLLNRYGQYVCIMYRVHLKTNEYKPYKIMLSKQDYLDEDFTIEDAARELTPISILGGAASFDPNPMKHDTSFRALQHCIEGNRDRLPQEIQGMPDETLAQTIQAVMERNLAICRCNKSFAKPVYREKEDKVQWLLPLHIKRRITEEPELVFVVDECNGLYCAKTILKYSPNIKDWVRATAPYSSLW